MKWWEDSVDEMWIGAMVALIACVAIWKGGAAGMTVAGTALGALGVYLGIKPGKKNGGQNVQAEMGSTAVISDDIGTD